MAWLKLSTHRRHHLMVLTQALTLILFSLLIAALSSMALQMVSQYVMPSEPLSLILQVRVPDVIRCTNSTVCPKTILPKETCKVLSVCSTAHPTKPSNGTTSESVTSSHNMSWTITPNMTVMSTIATQSIPLTLPTSTLSHLIVIPTSLTHSANRTLIPASPPTIITHSGTVMRNATTPSAISTQIRSRIPHHDLSGSVSTATGSMKIVTGSQAMASAKSSLMTTESPVPTPNRPQKKNNMNIGLAVGLSILGIIIVVTVVVVAIAGYFIYAKFGRHKARGYSRARVPSVASVDEDSAESDDEYRTTVVKLQPRF